MIGNRLLNDSYWISACCLNEYLTCNGSSKLKSQTSVAFILIGSLNSLEKIIKTEASEVLCSVAGPILLSSNKQKKNKKLSIYMRYSDLSGFKNMKPHTKIKHEENKMEQPNT